jgi:hypothetical protein
MRANRDCIQATFMTFLFLSSHYTFFLLYFQVPIHCSLSIIQRLGYAHSLDSLLLGVDRVRGHGHHVLPRQI